MQDTELKLRHCGNPPTIVSMISTIETAEFLGCYDGSCAYIQKTALSPPFLLLLDLKNTEGNPSATKVRGGNTQPGQSMV